MSTVVLGLGGSLRAGSATTLALQIALAGAAVAGASTRLLNLRDLSLPFYNGSTTLSDYHPAEQAAIRELLDTIAAADGIILASPTYHNTISGMLKNTLDLLDVDRGEGPQRFANKVVGLVTVQGGTSGTGVNTLTTLLLAARAMGGWVAPSMVSVPGSRRAFDESGAARDPVINQRLHYLGEEVARASTMFREQWRRYR